jgi:hypothetical protein
MGDCLCSASRFKTGTCIICCSDDYDDKLVTVTFKLDTIKASAVIRDETDLVNYLDANPNAVHHVHANCRRRFNRREDLERIQKSKLEDSCRKRKLRSDSDSFNYEAMRILCGLRSTGTTLVNQSCVINK